MSVLQSKIEVIVSDDVSPIFDILVVTLAPLLVILNLLSSTFVQPSSTPQTNVFSSVASASSVIWAIKYAGHNLPQSSIQAVCIDPGSHLSPYSQLPVNSLKISLVHRLSSPQVVFISVFSSFLSLS